MRRHFSGADRGTSPRLASSRAAITLVEMLVAMAITLLLMASVVQVFDLLGTAVAGSRSTMEMTDRVRQAQHLLQSDLAAISRPVVPWVTDEEGGYFEYVEGSVNDASSLSSGPTPPGAMEIDNVDAVQSGFLNYTPITGQGYKYDNFGYDSLNAANYILYQPNIPMAGPYEVTVSWGNFNVNRSDNAPGILQHAGGTLNFTMDQLDPSATSRQRGSKSLGTFNFNAGTGGFVRISRSLASPALPAGAYVTADSVRFTWAGSTSSGSVDSRLGDHDDVLMFTSRSTQRPYQGRIVDSSGNVSMIESPEAEIVWSCFEDGVSLGDAKIRTVYRRVLLIAPWASVPNADLSLSLDAFQDKHDLSARQEGGQIVLNTIQDLALRQNRYRHAPAFPHIFAGYRRLTGVREGEDVILPNALAFDVRIFDPGAPLFDYGGVAFGPCDPGYVASNVTASTAPLGYGDYVDLGMAWLPCNVPSGAPSSNFMAAAQAKSLLARTFDTWPSKYESDGVDQDGGNTGVDQAADGFASSGSVDGGSERETSAPYLAAPQGIEVKMRAYEGDARQIREVKVNQNFAQ